MSEPVTHLIIMGVAGCGKTTSAQQLSALLGWPVAEADDFHPQSNVTKMASGVPLTDEDRWPWLSSLRDWMTSRAREGRSTIVTCSALKRSYRDLLAGAEGRVRFVHLQVPPSELKERMEHREGHFMPPSLLPSQLATLEPLDAEEDGVVVDSRPTPELTLAAIVEALDLAAAPAPGSPQSH